VFKQVELQSRGHLSRRGIVAILGSHHWPPQHISQIEAVHTDFESRDAWLLKGELPKTRWMLEISRGPVS